MDGLSSAASVFAVIQLTGSVVKICGSYIQEVKDARDDIITLQQTVAGLQGILQKLREFLQGPRPTNQPTSSSLIINITNCLSDLEGLEEKIDPGRKKRTMRKFGIRALKWPLQRTEVERIIQNLERYKSAFSLSLHVDQSWVPFLDRENSSTISSYINSTLLTEISSITGRIDQRLGINKLPIAHGAEFNSYMDQHEVVCLPGTRTQLLRQITEWATSPQEKCIFWLNGMAGTGKSTISRTVAKSFSQTKSLGASFFF